MQGILWAVASGIGFGIFQVVNRKSNEGLDIYRGTFLLIFISAVLLLAISLFTEDISLLWNSPIQGILYFAIAGFVHFFLGWTLLGISQQSIGAARTGAIIGTTPLFAAAIAALTIHETLSIPARIGILLIVAGAYLVSS